MQQSPIRFFSLLGVALVALAVFASFPALRGHPVYEDRYIPSRDVLVDEVQDLGRTFWLSSRDLRVAVDGGADPVRSASYRPITSATFIATALVGGGFGTHHLVSLGLHVLVAFLIALALYRANKPAWFVALVAGVVVAHPFAIEAWVWVAGRADLVAGLAVAVIAVAIREDLSKTKPLGFVVGALALVAGTLAKETFIFVGPIVAMRGVFGPAASKASKASRAGLLALALLLPLGALILVKRKLQAESTFLPNDADLLVWLRRAPRLLGEATTTLLLPMPRAMRSLAFLVHTPLTTTSIIASAVFGVGIALSLGEKKFALALAFFGTAASLVLSAGVADHFWLGFDRFLYAPVVALAILGGEAIDARASFGANRFRFALPILVVGLAAASHLGSRAYSSNEAFVKALDTERPGDPSGHLVEAVEHLRNGDRRLAAAAAANAATSTAPALERERAHFLLRDRRATEARALVDAVFESRPNDAYAAAAEIEIAIAIRDLSQLTHLSEVAAKRPGSRLRACGALHGAQRGNVLEASALHESNEALRCSEFR